MIRSLVGALGVSLCLSVFAVPQNGPSVEDSLDRLRQAIVDLEISLRGYSDKNTAQVGQRIRQLEVALTQLRSTAAGRGTEFEARFASMERILVDLRTRLTRLEAGTNAPRQVQREIEDLTAEIRRLGDALRQATARPAPVQPQPRPHVPPPVIPIVCSLQKQYSSTSSSHGHFDSVPLSAVGTSEAAAAHSVCNQCTSLMNQRSSGNGFYIRVRCWGLECRQQTTGYAVGAPNVAACVPYR